MRIWLGVERDTSRKPIAPYTTTSSARFINPLGEHYISVDGTHGACDALRTNTRFDGMALAHDTTINSRTIQSLPPGHHRAL